MTTPDEYAEACERAADFADSEGVSDANMPDDTRVRSDILRALAKALREAQPERFRVASISEKLAASMEDDQRRDFADVQATRLHSVGHQPTGRLIITLPTEASA